MVQRRTSTILLLAYGLVGLGVGACSLLFATNDDQCSNDGDCRARGAGFESMRCSANVCVPSSDGAVNDGRGNDASLDGNDGSSRDAGPDAFGCISQPAPTVDPSRQIDLSLRMIDYSQGKPTTDMIVRLCGATDPECTSPRLTLQGDGPADAAAIPEAGSGWVMPTDGGIVTTKVEYGFEGYYQATGPGWAMNFLSTSPPLQNPTNSIDQVFLHAREIKLIADVALMGTGVKYDEKTLGLVFLFGQDCNLKPLSGMSFTSSVMGDTTRRFYVVNASPSLDDTTTDPTGRAGFLNLPPGYVQFTMHRGTGPTKQRIGAAQMLVRAGSVHILVVTPSL